jgi:riboflavin kinase/FMN adenylyltransferase
MRILRHYSNVAEAARGAVVAVGNFDGIHRGHQAVIAAVRECARSEGRPAAVLTFEPHPRSFFRPDMPPFRLTPFRIKARLIEALGVDALFVLRFDAALSRLTPEAFAEEVLVRGLGVRRVVIGDNFVFGRDRRGDVALLEALGRQAGFEVTRLERVRGPGSEIYSSTRIRDYLQAGDPTRAALLLGRYWEIEGRVLHGDRRGRTLGFPTANLGLAGYLEPARGVYAVRAGLEREHDVEWHAGVANLGVRPTVDGTRLSLEVHLFDFAEDIYGRHLRVALVDHLRPEIKFTGLDLLKAQIAEDGRRARTILASEHWEHGWPTTPFGPPRGE